MHYLKKINIKYILKILNKSIFLTLHKYFKKMPKLFNSNLNNTNSNYHYEHK